MAETAMSRYKRILGDHLHARKLIGQQAEAAITEPHRVCRRPFGLSHAAMVCSSSMA
jgi:hypothetical protein